jgi:hypothetical protein
VRDFTNRIKEKYPDAKIVNSTDLPPQNVLDPSNVSDDTDNKDSSSSVTNDSTSESKGLQYVQICTLTCSSEEELESAPSRWAHVDPPPRLTKYHTNTNVRVFTFNRISKEHQAPKPEKGVKVNEYR